ncbi:energy-coupling factor transporter transmembrane component T [Suipraeoptans intestinalis]|uniref:energy-coupling factor transporter transmembrane component T n=1 Tax=Suipraeoptans intestinalis TaxID=2606628 RepID=UPI0023F33B28|nr:energy-coupling factor transporter transmembrane component T [Suipraeoptans intestinalis]MDD7771043.1 energy-coupling factor transporter transmembrane component T [Suipraeoptans intestinalis]MDY3121423.1 energy-coupling factor transporter transmembrane component T [Suipraeoptans intestinalis]
MKKGLGQRIDIRTKLFMTGVISYVLLLGNLQQTYLAAAIAISLLPYLLLFLEKRYKESIRGGVLLLAAGLVQKFLLQDAKGVWASLFLFLTVVFLRMAPGIMMGKYAFVTTGMSDLVCALKKMRLPDQIVIPMTVMARFFYTVREDYRQVKDAMYLHGLTTARLLVHPVRLLEYRTVPLLMCLTRTADEVAVSALTRGMEVGKRRSSISGTKLTGIDYAFFALMLLVIGVYIRGKYA